MKRVLKFSLVAALCILLAACVTNTTPVDIWDNATYTEDVMLGTGEKSITVDVVTPEKTVSITVNTDKALLGEALQEHNLISGEEGAYGLYVKVVNGITADYESTKSYWSVNKNSEYMLTGVDSAEIADGDSYQFIYTEAE